ncbi:MAG: hypothetical protein U0S12_13090 [Fimbriimonadales bacterium]
MVAVVVALVMAQAPSAADFFPLVPGTKWTYQGDVGGLASTQVDVVKEPIEIDGKPAYPVVTQVSGRIVGSSYYRVEGDTVYLVAEDPKKPFQTPQPVLKVGSGRATWKFEGFGGFIGSEAPLRMNGVSVIKKDRPVLDRKVDALEVKLDTIMGSEGHVAMTGKQTAYYAKGIGLAELVSEQVVQKQRSKMSLKLVKFEPPQ